MGSGGNPERHRPLLAALADSGCIVVAPHFERLVSPSPTRDDLLVRARRLKLALDAVARPGLPVAGVGHSIGGAMLLALAGGEARTRGGDRLPITPDPRLERLVIFAPATDFFRGPKALDAVRIPIFAWAGARDEITPPEQTQFLRRTLNPHVPV
ncbi:MAG: alpha/beta fold hydrolase, partial [Steroidobacteraceae bacterium]